MWDFLLNKFIKISYALPVQHFFDLPVKSGKSGGSSPLSWVRFSCTRKHQWAVFSSCVNWLNRKLKQQLAIILTRRTSTGTANYPGTKLVGVALKLRKLNEKFAVVCSLSQQTLNLVISLWFFAEDGKKIYQNLKRTWKLLFLLIKPFCCCIFTAIAVVVA